MKSLISRKDTTVSTAARSLFDARGSRDTKYKEGENNRPLFVKD
jgi:hypothetical protein